MMLPRFLIISVEPLPLFHTWRSHPGVEMSLKMACFSEDCGSPYSDCNRKLWETATQIRPQLAKRNTHLIYKWEDSRLPKFYTLTDLYSNIVLSKIHQPFLIEIKKLILKCLWEGKRPDSLDNLDKQPLPHTASWVILSERYCVVRDRTCSSPFINIIYFREN